jgi:threonyl-tRNA synthetase
MRDEYDYEEVSVPHITKKDAYIASGHWQKFSDELFKVNTREGHEFAMKPMNCPHHAQIYASRARSYRDLPVRYRETTTCYRDEQTGELSGLNRTRAFAQDDAHVFCRPEQVQEEVAKIWSIIEKFYATLGFDDLTVRFSRHDSDSMASYSGAEAAWKDAESQLLTIIKDKVGDDYVDGVGEAAFYGPKIDFMGRDALGRESQVATIQLDFNQPAGFGLEFVDELGQKQQPVMIHAAIMGSIERFLSVYIEHVGGAFPTWLAPEQVRVLPVSDKFAEYGAKVTAELKMAGVRVKLDDDNESLGKRIRAAEAMKVPYTLIVGEREQEAGEVAVRKRGEGDKGSKSSREFLKDITGEIKLREA